MFNESVVKILCGTGRTVVMVTSSVGKNRKGSSKGPQRVLKRPRKGSSRGPQGVLKGSSKGPSRGPQGVRKGSSRRPQGVVEWQKHNIVLDC